MVRGQPCRSLSIAALIVTIGCHQRQPLAGESKSTARVHQATHDVSPKPGADPAGQESLLFELDTALGPWHLLKSIGERQVDNEPEIESRPSFGFPYAEWRYHTHQRAKIPEDTLLGIAYQMDFASEQRCLALLSDWKQNESALHWRAFATTYWQRCISMLPLENVIKESPFWQRWLSEQGLSEQTHREWNNIFIEAMSRRIPVDHPDHLFWRQQHMIHILYELPDASHEMLSPKQWLQRAQRLLAKQRHSLAKQSLSFISTTQLSDIDRCDWWLTSAIHARKTRQYQQASDELNTALACQSYLSQELNPSEQDYERLQTIVRRAHFLAIRIALIQNKVPYAKVLMQSFEQNYPTHSMLDDVLVWKSGTQEITSMQHTLQSITRLSGDQCARAWFMLGKQAFNQKRYPDAFQTFYQGYQSQKCPIPTPQRAQLAYWAALSAEKATTQHPEFQPSFADQPVSLKQLWADIAEGYRWTFYGQAAHAYDSATTPTTSSGEPPHRQASSSSNVQSCAIAADISDTSGHRHLFEQTAELLNRGLLVAAQNILQSLNLEAMLTQSRLSLSPQASTLERQNHCALQHTLLTLARFYKAWGDRQGAHQLFRQSDLAMRFDPDNATIQELVFPELYRETIEAQERLYQIPSHFLQALAREESAFDAQARSWAGALGLLQLMPATAKSVAQQANLPFSDVEQLLNPELNARLSAHLMGDLLRRYEGQKWLALIAYNAGPRVANRYVDREGILEERIENVSIEETRNYIRRVLRSHAAYQYFDAQKSPSASSSL